MYSKQDTWDMFRGLILANRMKRQNPTRTKSVGYLGKKMKYHLFRLLNIYKHV